MVAAVLLVVKFEALTYLLLAVRQMVVNFVLVVSLEAVIQPLVEDEVAVVLAVALVDRVFEV